MLATNNKFLGLLYLGPALLFVAVFVLYCFVVLLANKEIPAKP